MAIQYYADSDTSGNIVGYYNDDIHILEKIPTTAIKITEAQWQDCVANQGKWLIKSGALSLAPAPTAAKQLATVQASKIAELSSKCNALILAGFSSTALSVSHNYVFDYEAQQNLTSDLAMMNADSTIASATCKTTDAGRLTHTRVQFIQLCKDSLAFKNTQISKYDSLKAQVLSATTVSGVNAIVW